MAEIYSSKEITYRLYLDEADYIHLVLHDRYGYAKYDFEFDDKNVKEITEISLDAYNYLKILTNCNRFGLDMSGERETNIVKCIRGNLPQQNAIIHIDRLT